MFFALSKLAFGLLAPSNFSFVLLGLGLVLSVSKRWRQAGRRLAVAGFVLLAVIGFSPLGNLLLEPLEDRFAASTAPDVAVVTHIILLGGFEDARLSAARRQLVTNAAAERLLAIVPLARKYPSATIVFTGGYGAFLGAPVEASDAIHAYLTAAGIEPGRILVEGRSRTTRENAQFVKTLLEERKMSCPCGFLLVTSAWHMPRAVGIFRQVGFDGAGGTLYPWPVDYRTHGGSDDWQPFGWLYDGLRQTDVAAKEWIGLFVYWLRGWTSELWPGLRK